MTRAGKDGDPGGGFLARWSRRKQDARDGRGEADDLLGDDLLGDQAAPPPAVAGAPVGEVDESALSDEELLVRYELPDPETLTASDDVIAFMRKGVPARLRSLALRRLWRLDPVLANLDGLNDYDGDYTDAAMLAGAVKTVYQVGKGGAAHLQDAADRLADTGERAPEDAAASEASVEAASEAGKHEAAGGETHEDVNGRQGGEGPTPAHGDPSAAPEANPPAAVSAPEPPRRRRMVFAAPDESGLESGLNTGWRHFNK